MLSCYDLSLKINDQVLFQGVSFTCFGGGLLLVRGNNGCGKTSLLRMIAGIQSHNGAITFKNGLIQNLTKPYSLYIGHKTGIRSDLTVMQNLSFWSRLYNSELMLEAAVMYWNLYDILDVECRKLSSGNQKKVALAKLLCCNSDLWLLDEVDTNLDDTNTKLLKNLIHTKMESGGVIIVITHNNSININNSEMNTLYLRDFK